MEVTLSTVPGMGVLREIRTRAGQRFALLTEDSGSAQVLIYDEPVFGDASDQAKVVFALAPDEADTVADLLHSRPLADRVADLERIVAQLRAAGAPQSGHTWVRPR